MTDNYTDNEMSKISRAEYKRGISEEKARWKKKIEELKRQFCYPNKSMNTFQYARELEEGINELLGDEK